MEENTSLKVLRLHGEMTGSFPLDFNPKAMFLICFVTTRGLILEVVDGCFKRRWQRNLMTACF